MSASEAPVATRGSVTLEPGQRLGDFLVTRVVGQGGFGIVYEAEDLTLQRRVAIKEYMPSQLASRIDGTVNPVSARYVKTFELGRRSFVAEARLLAQFRHPGLLEVLHFWEQNGTAYMVMPFYEGRTLDQVLANGPQLVNEAWLKAVIRPVLDALEHMHGEDCYHRDVSADNILIRNDGTALLLDLGAARRVIGESDRALTVMLKPGYAPIEQYADDPACRQGPWTDIYAVAAVLNFAVTNRMPPASASRVMHDSLPSLVSLRPAGYSRRFLEAIDRGLSIRPEQRPRTVGEFRSLLFAASPDDRIAAIEPPSEPAAFASTNGKPKPDAASEIAPPTAGEHEQRWRFSFAWVGGAVALAVAIAVLGLGNRATPPKSPLDAAGPRIAAPVERAPVERASAESASAESASADEPSSSTKAVETREPIAEAGSRPTAQATSRPVAAPGSGKVRLAVSPWGEVFVDGASRGVTPPLKELTLDAGRHRIEIRNPAGPAWVTNIDVAAGQRTTVAHRFP